MVVLKCSPTVISPEDFLNHSYTKMQLPLYLLFLNVFISQIPLNLHTFCPLFNIFSLPCEPFVRDFPHLEGPDQISPPGKPPSSPWRKTFPFFPVLCLLMGSLIKIKPTQNFFLLTQSQLIRAFNYISNIPSFLPCNIITGVKYHYVVSSSHT